jgi:hypothetical protein
MLQLMENYHRRLIDEAARAGRFRLPMMAFRMLLCELLIVAVAAAASILGLDQGARWALVLPIGCLSMAMILHLGYVFTEGFKHASQQQA